jgi:beta-glucosidase
MNASDAFVAAWLPGSEGKAIADVLLTDALGAIQHGFKGVLSFSWPNSPKQLANRFDEDYQPLLPYGFGLKFGETTTRLNNLAETYELTENEDIARQVFNGKVQNPWQMRLTSNEEEVAISSSAQALTGIQYRTVDKIIQEDAFKLTLDGSSNAGIKFISDNGYSEDLSAEQENHAALILTLKRDEPVRGSVILSMNCESLNDSEGRCRGDVDITEVLNKTMLSQWTDLSVDLNCFAKKGVQFDKIVVPAELRSKGALSLSISNIHFEANAARSADVQCQ